MVTLLKLYVAPLCLLISPAGSPLSTNILRQKLEDNGLILSKWHWQVGIPTMKTLLEEWGSEYKVKDLQDGYIPGLYNM